ncbi:MAG: (2Fe-2S)-binding protein [Conexivisphaera sp.]
MLVKLTVNGQVHEVDVEPRTLLLDLLRELGYRSVHQGCDDGKCGACTVIMDGNAVKSCLIFAVQANGSEIMTAEGLATKEGPHPLQTAFHENFAVQCGYCTPGMLMTAYDFLSKTPEVDEATVRKNITGNLCRCTGYVNVVKAIVKAAGSRQAGRWKR